MCSLSLDFVSNPQACQVVTIQYRLQRKQLLHNLHDASVSKQAPNKTSFVFLLLSWVFHTLKGGAYPLSFPYFAQSLCCRQTHFHSQNPPLVEPFGVESGSPEDNSALVNPARAGWCSRLLCSVSGGSYLKHCPLTLTPSGTKQA